MIQSVSRQGAHKEVGEKPITVLPLEPIGDIEISVPVVLIEEAENDVTNDQHGESAIVDKNGDYVIVMDNTDNLNDDKLGVAIEEVHQGIDEGDGAVIAEPTVDEEKKDSKKKHKSVYKFQVIWDPVDKRENLGGEIRHHVVMAPVCEGAISIKDIHVVDFPENSPLYRAVKSCRDNKGIPIITGYWKHWDKPIAVLFDINHLSEELINRYCAELKRDRGIFIPNDDDDCRKSIVLGYCAAEFLIQFELAIGSENVSKKSWIRFHNWSTAAGAIFLKQWFQPRTQVTMVFSETRLGSLMPSHPSEALKMAHEARATHRYLLELAATGIASQVIVNKGVDIDMIEKQVFKKPSHEVNGPAPVWFGPVKRLFTRNRYEEMNKTRKAMIVVVKKRDNVKIANIPVHQ